MRQLGYDQSTIQVTGEMGYSNLVTIEVPFIGEGKAHIVSKFRFIFWPDKARMEMRCSGGSIYWKKNLLKMSEFVVSQDEKTS